MRSKFENNERHEVRDLHPGDLVRAALAPEAVEGVVAPLLELADDRRTIVFCVNRRHARAIAAALNAGRPGCAKHVDGSMRVKDREAVFEDHVAGKFQFLCNVILATEGYNDPAISCVAMVRPTESRVMYAQAAGRGLRLSPATGKQDMLLIDFVGVACKFDLVGPEDVLAGALVGPVRELRRVSKSGPAIVEEAYKPRKWYARFTTEIVELVKRGARATARGARATGRGAKRVGKGAWQAIKDVLLGDWR